MYISCSVGPLCAHHTSAKPEWNIHTVELIYISSKPPQLNLVGENISSAASFHVPVVFHSYQRLHHNKSSAVIMSCQTVSLHLKEQIKQTYLNIQKGKNLKTRWLLWQVKHFETLQQVLHYKWTLNQLYFNGAFTDTYKVVGSLWPLMNL